MLCAKLFPTVLQPLAVDVQLQALVLLLSHEPGLDAVKVEGNWKEVWCPGGH